MLDGAVIGESVVDLDLNFETEVTKFPAQHEVLVPSWAEDFSEQPPIYHGTSLEAVTQWAQSGPMDLLSHRAVHGISAFFQRPENTPGQTCGEDVKRGLDGFVFASVGRTALSDPGAFSSVIVLDPGVLDDGMVSFRELGDFGGILLSPKERFGQHREARVEKANERAFEQYIRTLVRGNHFKQLFNAYLTDNFDSIDQFLSSYDFVPGKPDLPKPGTADYDEQMARRDFFEQRSLTVPLHIREGSLYPGPQLIVQDKVPKKRVRGVILYDPTNGDSLVRATARKLEKRDIALQVIGPDDVLTKSDRVDASLFDRGQDEFRLYAFKNALFNLCFADVAQMFQTN